MTKFVFVTGGVVSSLGKGIAAASLGAILESRGLSVSLLKLDPYINVDPGTMSPFQHGEVFVTEDGDETDQDIGNYERFLGIDLTRVNYMTLSAQRCIGPITSPLGKFMSQSSVRSGAASTLGKPSRLFLILPMKSRRL